MCLELIKGQAKGKIADKDIVCYKVFQSPDYANACNDIPEKESKYLLTPFMNFGMVLNKRYTTKQHDFHYRFTRDYDVPISNEKVRSCVKAGVYHSFTSADDAVDFVNNYKANGIHMCYVKSTIPAGTKYYEGYYRCGQSWYRAYASKTIAIGDTITYPIVLTN